MTELERMFGSGVKRDLLDLFTDSVFNDEDFQINQSIHTLVRRNSGYSVSFYYKGKVYPIGESPTLNTKDLSKELHNDMDKILERMATNNSFRMYVTSYLKQALSMSSSIADIKALTPKEIDYVYHNQLDQFAGDSMLTISPAEIEEFLALNVDGLNQIKAYKFHQSLFGDR